MNSTAHATGRHPEDGMLLRFLDGECEADEREGFATHLAACMTCQARLDAFRALSATISRRLAGDAPMRQPARRRFPLLRAAAVIFCIGAAAASAQPISRWLTRLTRHTAAASHGATPLPVVRDSAGVARGHAGVSFVPAGTTLEITFRAMQRSGSLTMAPSADSSVAFGVSDGSVAPDVTVLPTGLVIANTSADTVSYRITIPGAVAAVSLTIGGDAPQRFAWHHGAGARIVTLAAAPH